MNAKHDPVSVTILEREYQVACDPEQKTDLIAAAIYLDAKMRELKSSSRTVNLDRIAVMVALNMANELLQLRQTTKSVDQNVARTLDGLKQRMDTLVQALDQRANKKQS